MKKITVKFDSGQWVVDTDGKIKKFPLKNMAINKAKFDARNMRPIILHITDENDNDVINQEINDDNVTEI